VAPDGFLTHLAAIWRYNENEKVRKKKDRYSFTQSPDYAE
jgi:hypothetical protein